MEYSLAISTPSPKKDTLFGPTVHEKIAYQILKKEGFFWFTLYINTYTITCEQLAIASWVVYLNLKPISIIASTNGRVICPPEAAARCSILPGLFFVVF